MFSLSIYLAKDTAVHFESVQYSLTTTTHSATPAGRTIQYSTLEFYSPYFRNLVLLHKGEDEPGGWVMWDARKSIREPFNEEGC